MQLTSLWSKKVKGNVVTSSLLPCAFVVEASTVNFSSSAKHWVLSFPCLSQEAQIAFNYSKLARSALLAFCWLAKRRYVRLSDWARSSVVPPTCVPEEDNTINLSNLAESFVLLGGVELVISRNWRHDTMAGSQTLPAILDLHSFSSFSCC